MVFYDIDDKRIERLAREVVDILIKPHESWDPNTINALNYILEWTSEIKLRSFDEWEKELNEDITHYRKSIKVLRETRKQIGNVVLPVIRDNNFKHKQARHLLDKLGSGEYAGLRGMMIPNNYDADKNPEPSYDILLIKDNILPLTDEEIRIIIGHEFAHVYLKYIDRGRLYELDDKAFCDFIAEEWFGVNKRNNLLK